jgi:hypothetical protein
MSMTETLIVILLLLLPIAYINTYFLLKRLKARHNETWIALGKPQIFDSNLSKQTKSLSGFLWRGRFLHLKDAQLSFICVTSMALWLGAFTFFVFVLFV